MDRTFRTSTTGFIRAFAIGSLLISGLDAANRVGPAFASSPVLQDGTDADQSRLVGDFLHYALIAKPDLADAAGRTLVDSGTTHAQLGMAARSFRGHLHSGCSSSRWSKTLAPKFRCPQLLPLRATLTTRR